MQPLNSSRNNFAVSFTANPLEVTASVVLGLCFLVGVPANIAVIVVIARKYEAENFTLKLMLNLAVCDVFSLLTLPMLICGLLYGWIFHPLSCKLIYYFLYWNICSNLLTVTLMSVQRYLAVLYPQHWARLRGMGERVLLGIVWGLSGVLTSYVVVVMNVKTVSGLNFCIRYYRSKTIKLVVMVVETLLGFMVPFSTLVIFYFCLLKRVNQTAFFSSPRMTRLVTSIVVTFFIFWSPFHLFNVLQIFSILLKSDNLFKFSRTGSLIAEALTLINSCVDPFLYALSSRKLRRSPRGTTEVISPRPNVATVE